MRSRFTVDMLAVFNIIPNQEVAYAAVNMVEHSKAPPCSTHAKN